MILLLTHMCVALQMNHASAAVVTLILQLQ